MARILIGWELGAHTGHIRRMLGVAKALAAAGHTIAIAPQRIDSAGDAVRDYELWQAPVWPRLLATVARPSTQTTTHADVLAGVGLGEPGAFSALVRGWEALIAGMRADLVVAEYAPALLRAAAGRVPTVSTGTGFEVVPPTMASFPTLTGDPPVTDEAALLAATNAELKAAGRPELAALPEIFAADAPLACTFAEFDPYAQWRSEPVAPPQVPLPIPLATEQRGSEVFIYWPENYASGGAVWEAIRASGLPVRIHAPAMTATQVSELSAAGFMFEPRPLPFDAIVPRTRIVVSHGGAGITSSALVAGLPHVVVPIDLEKMGQAIGVTKLGTGGWSAPRTIVAEKFAADLKRLAHDDALAARCRSEAVRLRGLFDRDCGAHALERVERLLRA